MTRFSKIMLDVTRRDDSIQSAKAVVFDKDKDSCCCISLNNLDRVKWKRVFEHA